MATFMEIDRVLYLSAENKRTPICKLYFCRHCLKLRCSDGVFHEVDSHYCPNCLENMPSTEAKLKKNRCANCFDCPRCFHTLSTRATSMPAPEGEQPKRVYYLACGFCRWTSRDSSMKDQLVASGGWKEEENPHSKRIGQLLDYYRQLAQLEKAEKERKKYTRRRGYLHLSDKYGLTTAAARHRSSIASISNLSLKETEDLRVTQAPQSEAVKELEPLPMDYYTSPVVLPYLTTVKQRLSSVDFQPKLTKDLLPRHKHLLVKCSQRCRECEHNLSKPEFNPSSIKFKIQLVALHHVPEIRIMRPASLQCGQQSLVSLSLCNPCDHLMHVILLPTDREDDDYATAKVILPTSELVLAPRDDTAEFDESFDAARDYADDPGVVIFRKANKIGFNINVIPEKSVGDVKIMFRLKYDYRNMTTALTSDNKEPDMVWLQQYVYVNLGQLTPA